MRNRKVFTWVTILCTLSLGACGYDLPGAARADGGEEVRSGTTREAPERVVVQEARPVTELRQETLPATLDAWEVTPLFARVTGYLEAVSVDIGDELEAGAEIARLLVPEMAAELRSAEAQVARERAELDLAKKTSERLTGLRQRAPEAIPGQDVDVAAAQVDVEAAQVNVAVAELERLLALSRYAVLKAPFKGRVVARSLDTGALAREGTTSGAVPVVTIARTDRLRLAFDVPEPLVRQVRPGLEVRVRYDAFPGEESVAKVARVSGALDPATRSMRAEVDLDNPKGRFRPGMYASVTITAPPAESAVGVPSRAVRGQGDDRFCLVAVDGVLHRRPVVVTEDDGRRAIITEGLTAGDRVCVAASPLVAEGMPVDAVLEEPTR